MGDSSAIDSLLIRYAGNKTPDEIGEITGIDPLAVAQRTKDILKSIDYFDIQEKRARLIIVLEGIIAEVDSRKSDASDRNLAGLLNSSRATVATILKELRDMEKASKVDVNAITANQGQVLAELINIPIQHLRDELKDRYGTDDDEIDEIVADGIRLAYSELESRVDS